ncbi:MAG: hypothetical protein K9W46_05330 [Candidatus Heimdallarchaeum endolithica]|uniref:arginine decarboxylase n=1 Tax=Candidatus Heimdallarchaeum endolithica TaxID=2876572 RepID=A0A9Y1BUU4_9ARCH|nr:MAG: hypothetical protein K9W46_05330 [Candidatus Heimdallarchaeum endolithica]
MTWCLSDSKFIYGVNRNDLYFLDINDQGELLLKLKDQSISFNEIINLVKSQFSSSSSSVSSFTLRVPQLITEQISKLSNCFLSTIQKYQYTGSFQGIYPIKVNSLSYVLETIKNHNSSYAFEAGTVNELEVLLSLLSEDKNRMIMCNGVKDYDYVNKIREALNDGYSIVISLESCSESATILDSIDHDLLKLALRIKPYPTVKSHWGSSSGRDSKFGLSIHEFKRIIDLLEKKGVKDKVMAIHAHPGSQVIDIDGLRNFVLYLSNRYLELKSLGFTSLKNIDFGGGIPINYDNRLPSDILENYIKTIILTLKETITNPKDQPNIWIEAGRFVTASSSLIIIETIALYSVFPPKNGLNEHNSKFDTILNKINHSPSIPLLFSNWTDFRSPAIYSSVDEILNMEIVMKFLRLAIRKKMMNLEDEQKFNKIFDLELDKLFYEIYSPEYILIGNFSVFNTIIDWLLVYQYFPILPTTNLNQQPFSLVRLVDKTCDSDGEVSIYHPVFNEDKILYTTDGFPLTIKDKKFNLMGFPIGCLPDKFPFYLVIALTGAYQDNIKMHHNLIEPLSSFIITHENGKWNVFHYGDK